MIKRIGFLLILIWMGCLIGCESREDGMRKASLVGTVEKIGSESVLIRNGDGLYTVSLRTERADSQTGFAVGEEITVYYDGSIAETYPMQIYHVYTIERKADVK